MTVVQFQKELYDTNIPVLFFALSFGSSKCLLLGPIPKRKRAVAKRSAEGT